MQSQRDYWDRVAPRYEHKYGYDTDSGYNKLCRKVNLLINVMGLKRGDNLLELGCGTGAYTRLLSSRGLNVMGIDASEKMLSQARRFQGDYRQYDIHNLPFKFLKFDAVIGFYVLQYADVPQVLSEVYRVLKDNGKTGFIEPNSANPLVYLKTKCNTVKKLLGISSEATSFSDKELIGLLGSGFKDISIYHLEYGMLRILSRNTIIKKLSGSLLISGVKQ